MRRGQAAVEWVVILSVAILILAVMLSFNEENYLFFRNNMKVSKAKAALNELKNSADFVYSQGSGAKTRVYVTIPVETNITIETLSTGTGQIQAEVLVNGEREYFDVYTEANLSGSLPEKGGSYCVDIECLGEVVSITRSSGSCST
ncbi:MAG: hypothetical protein GF416_05255 [Candidatus Altiarchaeales archaeon]|nr:hypothetical protein [Candidatus Altiarchaeales archaeon]MBD3416524.1 hypothetical protein [Candidatus Altiarchaeales archaeon]